HFASSRPKEPGQRFGLTICGSKGCIGMTTGWMLRALLLDDPTWIAAGPRKWTPITGPDEGRGGSGTANDLIAGNRAIVAALIRAVETDTQPRTDARSGRAAIEMILACYASHSRGGIVTLPLAERDVHPLARLIKA